MKIPFHVPELNKNTFKYIKKAIDENQTAGNKKYTSLVNTWLQDNLKIKYALFVNSCTSALELSALTLGLKPGDEVILPSFTFVSTANAFIKFGVKPVFADIKEVDLNIDVKDIEKKINNKTRAIIPVHYAGQSCDMDEIIDLSKNYNLKIIEDAAQGFDAKYKNKYLGTIGDIGCISFHETKNVICGEGGAFLTNNKSIFKKAEIISEKGTNRSQFLRGQVNKYTWVDIGSSYIQSDILASFLLSQFEIKDEIKERRRKIYYKYLYELNRLSELEIIKLPIIKDNCDPNFHIFYVLLKSESDRNKCLAKLKQKGINATFHYIPLHSSPFGMKHFDYKADDLPITEKISKRIIRLPIYPSLSSSEQSYIIESLYSILLENE